MRYHRSFRYMTMWQFSSKPSTTLNSPTRARVASFLSFLDHTQWFTTVGRTPLDEGSARRRDFYLTTYNTDNRQASMPPAGFETSIPASDRPQTLALDHSATGMGLSLTSSNHMTLHAKEIPVRHTQFQLLLRTATISLQWIWRTLQKMLSLYFTKIINIMKQYM